ncbi:hypothetical protein [Chryseobacterium oryzae]|uniref:Lipoprotein n=1 Tax=Chryseobacterium oryzae TaxID=2929799 RepID=A0ABY4BCX5_9FLAO|nr:hypothetical protein [Chryseobacterium oryzae]UOE36998.1 hypothetical protein MTP08_07930 [Chryseobacterium oryzae]
MAVKNLIKSIFLIIILSIFSCNSIKNNYKLEKNLPIVDYNKSYEYYDNSISLNNAIQKKNEQTLILYNKKQINKEKFNNLLNKKKIKSIEIIEDSAKISSFGFSFKNVKTIMFTKSDASN